jgi:hypothetical protein
VIEVKGVTVFRPALISTTLMVMLLSLELETA